MRPALLACLLLGQAAALGAATDTPLDALHPQAPLIPVAAQPYVQVQSFVSPLTGEGFSAPVQSKRAPVASYDFDFCPHPPFNTYAYSLVTDPATGWTDFPESFNQRCPLTREQVASVLGEPKFNRTAPEGLPWLNPYPWEQYENAALQAEALKLGPLSVGNWYMQAAWSVRLDVVAGSNPFDPEVTALFDKLPRPQPAARDSAQPYELQIAAKWEQARQSGVLDNVGAVDFALAQAWLYRARGELAGTERWLDEAAAADRNLPAGGGLYSFLRSSVELEQSYLSAAQSQFGAAWAKGGIDARRQGLTALALGEIARRLGDLPAARRWYDEAGLHQHGEINLNRLAQLNALAVGRGY
jgi:hypothetical protein